MSRTGNRHGLFSSRSDATCPLCPGLLLGICPLLLCRARIEAPLEAHQPPDHVLAKNLEPERLLTSGELAGLLDKLQIGAR